VPMRTMASRCGCLDEGLGLEEGDRCEQGDGLWMGAKAVGQAMSRQLAGVGCKRVRACALCLALWWVAEVADARVTRRRAPQLRRPTRQAGGHSSSGGGGASAGPRGGAGLALAFAVRSCSPLCCLAFAVCSCSPLCCS
jgi:hypothetical protein